ncbi:MarR family transcriptional regulator [Lactobacillus bombicola]|uniref:MarR family transcriptional regulator n=1 Tax=Lactobacillus bombicola TaxID=1505723 RepID=A0ABX9LW00_9LACO|nr:MarR family winged helix-turn-helix transcriptional regulator [Lactobacillus bombicola]RHW52974.1 MarR family transcriptional regulator [Lactobacillus bombicola]
MDILSFDLISETIKKEIKHKCGLNLSQTRLLLYFAHNDNKEQKMGDLAKKLKISLSTLSRQLQQKNTLSLITITRSESDSSKTVHLNEHGIKKIAELRSTVKNIEEFFLTGFSENEIDTFNQVFTKLIQKTKGSK